MGVDDVPDMEELSLYYGLTVYEEKTRINDLHSTAYYQMKNSKR